MRPRRGRIGVRELERGPLRGRQLAERLLHARAGLRGHRAVERGRSARGRRLARGVRRGYYTDNREDALIMWKDPVGVPADQADTG